jgi:ABC-type sugar transport system permease subunit
MAFASKDIGSAVAIALVGVSTGLILDWRTEVELDRMRAYRVVLDARAAVSSGAKVQGDLTVVRGTDSAKYYFLNKRSYVIHTASTAREGTVLSGSDPEDKARADRHAEVLRKKTALETRLPGGAWRVTVPDNFRSAELVQDPPPVPRPSPIHPALLSMLAGVIVLALLRFGVVPRYAGPIATTAAAAAAVYFAGPHFFAASTAAMSYLAEGRSNAPNPTLPPHVARVFLGGAGVTCVGLSVLLSSELAVRAVRALRSYRHAYAAITPAMVGLSVLVGIPFAVGMGLSLFHHVHGTYSFAGIDNFVAILGSTSGDWFAPQSLPYSLVLTVFWTALNVALHVTIGLALALALQNRAPRVSKIYRVLLIIPWAVPAYLTALIWRSMFDPDIGVVNAILGLQGFSWMHDARTAFLANLVTNVWLGFPFMMVVSLGALTSIPKDLYEAADVDGATELQKLTRITLPLLQPALLPAVILGSIWTFNKFEVIYLVSEGKPDGATEILVTEAYKWAFERGLAQGGAYGYAAAYSVIIFAVLLLYGWMTSRIAKKAEEALR